MRIIIINNVIKQSFDLQIKALAFHKIYVTVLIKHMKAAYQTIYLILKFSTYYVLDGFDEILEHKILKYLKYLENLGKVDEI